MAFRENTQLMMYSQKMKPKYYTLSDYGVEEGLEFEAERGADQKVPTFLRRAMLAVGLLGLIGSVLLIAIYSTHRSGHRKRTECTGHTGAIEFVSRKEWGARPPREPPIPIPPTNMTFLHNSEGPNCRDKEACIKVVQGIQRYHMDEKHWDDIGYNFLVGEDGRVYEGRGWQIEGAQTRHYNFVSHGICMMGNYMRNLPNLKAITTAKSLMEYGLEKEFIKRGFELFGHRDGGCTDCPGDALYADLQTWPHYSTRKIPNYCPER